MGITLVCSNSLHKALRGRVTADSSNAGRFQLRFRVLADLRFREPLEQHLQNGTAELAGSAFFFDEMEPEIEKIFRLQPFGFVEGLRQFRFVSLDELSELTQAR